MYQKIKDLGKVDIDPDLVSDTKVFIEYKVIVKIKEQYQVK